MTTTTDTSTTAATDIGALADAAREAARGLPALQTDSKNRALEAMATALRDHQADVLAANESDVERAHADAVAASTIDRLTLTPDRIHAIADAIGDVIRLPDPIGAMEDVRRLPNGMQVGRRRVPLGVVAAIFEARPNVAVDISALCLKAGNAVILRGGSEAHESTLAITAVIRAAAESAGAPPASIQVVTDPDRSLVRQLLRMNRTIDVVIPRGGAGLINFVTENATVPVIETGWGVCHTYVDADADLEMARAIVVNAKTRRPSICNALDTLLVHRSVAPRFLPAVGAELAAREVEIHADDRSLELLADVPTVMPLQQADFDTEWLALRMSVAVVDDLDAGLAHIHAHGSGHSEAIVTESHRNATRFLNEVDAAAVYLNASTQFTDGGEFGLGAEVGISTQKLHARGPMGLREMTTYKWIVLGDGHIRP